MFLALQMELLRRCDRGSVVKVARVNLERLGLFSPINDIKTEY